ncbi:hypothetical protein [Aeoliella sp.]|uniref:hypothetical protein n=1 Tax=Aeoliella sp. TaxID=2795800 RepID=UPI003CCBF053
MIKKAEGWSIVLLGYWNRMIFTPEWVGSNLFGSGSSVETVVALLPVLPIIYRDTSVSIEISNSRIICRSRRLDSEHALQGVGKTAHEILRLLPETPVKAIGVNYEFVENSPSENLVELFSFGDDAPLGEAGWTTEERKIVRRLSDEDDDTLNFTLTYGGEELTVSCNFHTAVDNDHDIALGAVADDRVANLEDKALLLLKNYYGLILEESDE